MFLTSNEWLSFSVSIFLILLEGVVHICAFCLPRPVIRFFYRISQRLFDYLSAPPEKLDVKQQAIANRVADADDFSDLCALFGYAAEEHVVLTKDGYLLGLHRLPSKRSGTDHIEECVQANGHIPIPPKQEFLPGTPGVEPAKVEKPVVYLHHGLLMNSEVWVSLTTAERCLPFQLVEAGYDVWLGNSRGNKYSKKSVKYSSSSAKFWDFSMDEFAFHDIPDSIDYVLRVTGQESLSYIGFSQGTAQALAALSVHNSLNRQINCFIGLAPAMSPTGLSTSIVDSLVKASPTALFLAFGRGAILNSAPIWQTIFYRPLFIRVIDWCVKALFGWHCNNMSYSSKLAAYPHLYSFTSVKSVVHWFQIIRTKTFQMYDNDMGTTSLTSLRAGRYRFYKPAKFPTRNIRTPNILLMYGGVDSLVDIDAMLRELPRHTRVIPVPHYEHLDFLWADDVAEKVMPHVFAALKRAHGEEPTRAERLRLSQLQREETAEMLRKTERAHAEGRPSISKTLIPPVPREQEGWKISEQRDRRKKFGKKKTKTIGGTEYVLGGAAAANASAGANAGAAAAASKENHSVSQQQAEELRDVDGDGEGHATATDDPGDEAARPVSRGTLAAVEGR
ncbi:cholesterol esterase [Ascosphaera acerosa]|nr:cholesterol esterase [Ascosphaera acerosa]